MKPYLKLLPGLNPLAGWRAKTAALPYPLQQGEFFYFERNAIWWGLKVLGLDPGDEVLMPAYNSDTEEQVLEHAGLKLKYFDVKPDASYNYAALEKLVTAKTQALYLIHYFGFAQAAAKAKEFCARHDLVLLEDCALSLFAKTNGRYLGEFGDVSFFCLRKYLQIPNGGTLIINKDISFEEPLLQAPSKFSTLVETQGLILKHLAKSWPILRPLVKIFRLMAAWFNRFRTRSGEPLVEKDKFDWYMSGISHRILDRLDYGEIIKKRQENYLFLKSRLEPLISKSEKLNLFPAKEQPGFAPFCLPLLVDDNCQWQQALSGQGIETGAWWHHDPRPELKAHCPNNIYLRRHLLEIPIHQGLDKSDMDYIASQIEKLLK